VALAIFTLAGPLQRGWARRAGTPASILARFSVRPSTSTAAPVSHVTLHTPFEARLAGTATQTQAGSGAIIDLSLRVKGGARGLLRIRLAGAPMSGGGLSLTGSQVDLLADGLPTVMDGKIVQLAGGDFVADVAGSGMMLRLHGALNIADAGAVSGTLHGTRVGRGA
jgi:hypothetical protein